MSSLLRYLAPARITRPNPGHLVEWRHAEGGPWLPMADVADLEDAASELAYPTAPLTLGDLVRVRDPDGFVVRFLVQTGGGLVDLPSAGDRQLLQTMLASEMVAWCKACGHDWERAWEGAVRADAMLDLAGWAGVDPRLLVQAACDCAETALPYVPRGWELPRQTIETARRWARGEASDRERQAALDAARAAAGLDMGEAARAAVRAAVGVADVGRFAGTADGSFAGTAAREAAESFARASTGVAGYAAGNAALRVARSTAFAAMAPLVCQRIPLWQLALALAAKELA